MRGGPEWQKAKGSETMTTEDNEPAGGFAAGLQEGFAAGLKQGWHDRIVDELALRKKALDAALNMQIRAGVCGILELVRDANTILQFLKGAPPEGVSPAHPWLAGAALSPTEASASDLAAQVRSEGLEDKC